MDSIHPNILGCLSFYWVSNYSFPRNTIFIKFMFISSGVIVPELIFLCVFVKSLYVIELFFHIIIAFAMATLMDKSVRMKMESFCGIIIGIIYKLSTMTSKFIFCRFVVSPLFGYYMMVFSIVCVTFRF